MKNWLTITSLLLSLNTFSQVGIGTTNPNNSAKLEVYSSTKGFLLPRVTLLERNAISLPSTGLQVWCSDCGNSGDLQIFNGTSWVNSVGVANYITVPSAPLNVVATVLGYTSANLSFSTPISNGGTNNISYTISSNPAGISLTTANTSVVLTGLNSGTTYTFSVVATNSFGSSSAVSASSVTLPVINGNAVCDGSGYIDIVELTSSTGKIWMDRNLGASRAPNSSSDYYAYGCLYQWGRGDDGHASINWNSSTSGTPVNASISTLSSNYATNNSSFITNTSSPFDWLSNQNNTLWQSNAVINNPCPTGFRLPTTDEFEAEINMYLISNASSAYSNGATSGFKFLVPGERSGSNGIITNTGNLGSYWTQSVNGTNATAISFTQTGVTISNSLNRTQGLSVRCIKGNPSTESLSLITFAQNGSVLIQFNAITNATDYVFYYKPHSNITSWTTYPDGVSTTSGVTIEGLTNGVEYDFMVKAVLTGSDNIISKIVSATPTSVFNYNVYHQILTTGRSLAIGCCGAALTTTQPYSNKMKNTDLNATSLIPLIEPVTHTTNETKSSAMANFISSSTYNNTNGANFKSVVSVIGVYGAVAQAVQKGSESYEFGLSTTKNIKNILQSQNQPCILSAVTLVYGDGNETESFYKPFLVQMQSDFETDIKKITGQTGTIPLFQCQVSSGPAKGLDYTQSNAAIAQLKASEENPLKIYLVTPKYIFDYSNLNDPHMTNYSFRRLGEYYGKVMKKVLVDGVAWKPLSPSTVSIAANVITINFNVPVAPLQFDTVKVMNKANYGFEYYDATNSATISNVAIGSNGTSVIITLSSTPTGANKKIAYAYSSNTSTYGSTAGGRYNPQSPKGNLRDSDTTPALYTTNLPTNFGTELNNWCVHFIKDIN